MKEIRAEMGIDKGQDKKRKAVPVHDLSKTEGIEYVCCKSDAYDSEDEVLKKQIMIELAPFVPKYCSVPKKDPKKAKGSQNVVTRTKKRRMNPEMKRNRPKFLYTFAPNFAII